jgi:BlaI family transcriptional regulator, penicillinase repressor
VHATNKLVDVGRPAASNTEVKAKEERLARSKSATLTEAELRIMNVLWEKGSATVHEVLQGLSTRPSLAYNSVLTTIRILETKGYVKHLKDKRAHVYMPKIDRKDATRSEVRHLVGRFFGNSHEQLVLNILEEGSIDADELARVRKLLESSKVETE